MEVSDQNLLTLSNYLQQTLNPHAEIRRPAEKFLETVESNQNYPKLLLHLINKQDSDLTIRVAGAVAFKNLVKRNWPIDEENGIDKIHADDRAVIKQTILDIMLMAHESVQKQLSDAIAIISKHDFPDKWPGLIDEMVNKFNSGEFYIINGVLHTAHSLFKKYRFEFKSQKLWTEIKHVLDKFAKPLTDLFEATMQLTITQASNPDSLKIIYNSLLIISKIFYSLNFQDLPEFFEDNMQKWMTHFHTLLIADVKCLQTEDEEDAGLLEQLKSQVCENISLYASNYDEEFGAVLPNFVTDVWNLLINLGKQHKYDTLVSCSLKFLATVADRIKYRHLFEQPDVLSSICENVIIPNMEFRPSDEEMFEDNPEEYIRRDIEGSDVDTRRRSACDLVRVLSRYFEEKMMQIFGQYVEAMLQQYAANNSHWKHKDAALYLITSLASKGQTQKHGVTQTSLLVPLPEFTAQHIVPELQKPNVNEYPVIKADAIKYIMTFRSVLPSEIVIGTLPFMITHLQAKSQVVHTYAAYCIEKMLILKDSNKQPILTSKDLAPVGNELMNGLFRLLNCQGQENEYIMKAIMRSFVALQESVIPYLGELLPKLTEILKEVSKNPSKPHFNHYLFETITFSINIVCKTNPTAVTSFEEALFPIFQHILQQDVQEFLPYVFQLLALLLELHTEQNVPAVYLQLYPCLLTPALWERNGHIHPLVKLLKAYVIKASPEQIESTLALNSLLGVFQKLIASRLNDHEGFNLIQSLVEHCPKNLLAPFTKQIFILLFQRLSTSRTSKFVKGLLIFFFLYAIYYTPSVLISTIDGIQAQMFGMVLERVMIADVQKISGSINIKIAGVGLTKLLCESPELIDGAYSRFWSPLLKALINLFEQPQDSSILPDDHLVDEDTAGYDVAYSQLMFAKTADRDPLQAVPDARIHLAQCLSKLSIAYPGRLSPLLSTGLTDVDRSHLNQYLTVAKVQIN